LRKLYRSRENKILAGVCGGVGEYFQIDPVIIRLLWIVLSLVWGFGVILYIIAIFIIPPEPQENHYSDNFEETSENEPRHISHNLEDEDRKVVIGLFALLFIVIGLIILVSIITPSTFFFRNFIKIVISILLIGIGAYLISKSRTKK